MEHFVKVVALQKKPKSAVRKLKIPYMQGAAAAAAPKHGHLAGPPQNDLFDGQPDPYGSIPSMGGCFYLLSPYLKTFLPSP